MTPVNMPLTVYQSHDNAEHADLLKRFWRIAPRACIVCDEPFRPGTNASRQVYCSPGCQERAMVIMRRVKHVRSAA